MDRETILALANHGIGTDRTEKMTKPRNNSSVQLGAMILNADLLRYAISTEKVAGPRV